jgi:hypothetical protein
MAMRFSAVFLTRMAMRFSAVFLTRMAMRFSVVGQFEISLFDRLIEHAIIAVCPKDPKMLTN